MSPGALQIDIADRESRVALVGDGTWTMPVGPVSLFENELERADRPTPESLTNALGIVTDHLDDIVRDEPLVLDATDVAFGGDHAAVLARVEIGRDVVPDPYVLARADADEVFRTLVSETPNDRVHNPGLDPAHVDTIIGTCCVVLAVMRRLELSAVSIESARGTT